MPRKPVRRATRSPSKEDVDLSGSSQLQADLEGYALEDVITYLRALIQRYYDLVQKNLNNEPDLAKGMEILGRASARLGRLVEIRQKLIASDDNGNSLSREVINILSEIDTLIERNGNGFVQ